MSDLRLIKDASFGMPERKPMGVIVKCLVLPGLRRRKRLLLLRKVQESVFIAPMERLLFMIKNVWWKLIFNVFFVDTLNILSKVVFCFGILSTVVTLSLSSVVISISGSNSAMDLKRLLKMFGMAF